MYLCVSQYYITLQAVDFPEMLLKIPPWTVIGRAHSIRPYVSFKWYYHCRGQLESSFVKANPSYRSDDLNTFLSTSSHAKVVLDMVVYSSHRITSLAYRNFCYYFFHSLLNIGPYVQLHQSKVQHYLLRIGPNETRPDAIVLKRKLLSGVPCVLSSIEQQKKCLSTSRSFVDNSFTRNRVILKVGALWWWIKLIRTFGLLHILYHSISSLSFRHFKLTLVRAVEMAIDACPVASLFVVYLWKRYFTLGACAAYHFRLYKAILLRISLSCAILIYLDSLHMCMIMNMNTK